MQLCTTDTWIYLLPRLVFTRYLVLMNFRILYFNFLPLTLLLSRFYLYFYLRIGMYNRKFRAIYPSKLSFRESFYYVSSEFILLMMKHKKDDNANIINNGNEPLYQMVFSNQTLISHFYLCFR